MIVVNIHEMEYRRRINEVLAFIDDHFREALPLSRLAGVAGFSPFHFHRIFQSFTGESLHEYIKRIRLGRAAHQLLYSRGKTITEIALDCGFTSSSSFTRAFTEVYMISPRKYRERRNAVIAVSKARIAEKAPKPEYDKNVRLAALEDLFVAYIRTGGLSKIFRSARIEAAYSQLIRWSKARGLINPDTKFIGFIPDNPETIDLSKCRYLACVTVPEETRPQGAVDVRWMPTKGSYLVYTFERTSPDFPKVYFDVADYLFGHYLPEYGYVPDDKPLIEMYRYGETKSSVLVDLYIPVLPF